MRCVFCGHIESKVIDSRSADDGSSIRRRRECTECMKRFTTFEVLESVQIFVIKKNGETELFDRTKLLAGVLKATQKRPVSADEIVSEIESEIQNSLHNEVESAKIGEMVMDKLKERDHIAYVRFASVYREFKDVNTFMNELKKMLGKMNYYTKTQLEAIKRLVEKEEVVIENKHNSYVGDYKMVVPTLKGRVIGKKVYYEADIEYFRKRIAKVGIDPRIIDDEYLDFAVRKGQGIVYDEGLNEYCLLNGITIPEGITFSVEPKKISRNLSAMESYRKLLPNWIRR